MKNKDTYKNKAQNMFTAYVVRSVGGARLKYLGKKNYRESMENYLEDDAGYEPVIYFEEDIDGEEKERLLEAETRGEYPAWDHLSNEPLMEAVKLLKREERELIFKYVFEEKSFDEISEETGKTRNNLKNQYYYAIKKIRKWMGGRRV